jgi:hypothetical protein
MHSVTIAMRVAWLALIPCLLISGCQAACPEQVPGGGSTWQFSRSPVSHLIPPDWDASVGTAAWSEIIATESASRRLRLSVLAAPGLAAEDLAPLVGTSTGHVQVALAGGRVVDGLAQEQVGVGPEGLGPDRLERDLGRADGGVGGQVDRDRAEVRPGHEVDERLALPGDGDRLLGHVPAGHVVA